MVPFCFLTAKCRFTTTYGAGNFHLVPTMFSQMPLQALLHHVPFFTNRMHISVLPLMALYYMTLQCLTTCVVLITNFTMGVPFGDFLYILGHNFFLFYNIPFTFSLFGSTRYCPTQPPSLPPCLYNFTHLIKHFLFLQQFLKPFFLYNHFILI